MVKDLLLQLIEKYPQHSPEIPVEEAVAKLMKLSSYKNKGREPDWLILLLQSLIDGTESAWISIPPPNRKEDLNYSNLLSNLVEYTNSELDHQGETAEYVFYGNPNLYFIIDFESNRWGIKKVQSGFSLNRNFGNYPKL